MQKSFFLSKDGAQVGPFTVDEVRQKLEVQEHTWMDYVYDDEKSDWVLLIEHPVFSEKFNNTFIRGQANKSAPSASNSKASAAPSRDKEWYTLKNGSNFGPFSHFEMIIMLQEKNLFEYDYIWHQSLPTWKRVAEVEVFKPEKMRQMMESNNSEVAEIFFRRRHLRTKFGCSLIVHNNKSVFRGKSLEISAGGAGVMIDCQSLSPGESLFLHFQPGEGVPPFNAVCTIVSKEFVKDTVTAGDPVKYGIKFTSVSQSIREQIRGLAEARKVG
ncbi:MAG: DUF4339 domain-containing protein [Bdellovibrionaceae bacterium]|nr:DUF4339 domain-containing protein [Pseudobdellovibrionaceae bacterium]